MVNTDIVAGVDFNRDDDKKEFNLNDRVVGISCSKEGRLFLSVNLGRKEDDQFYLDFDLEEFVQKLVRAITEPE